MRPLPRAGLRVARAAAWLALIVRHSASRVSAFIFLTPIFGILVGHVVLGEPLSAGFIAAAALVAGGLILVNRPGGAQSVRKRR